MIQITIKINLREKKKIEAANKRRNRKWRNFSGSGLEWDGSDYYLVVQGSKSSSNEGSNPENPLKGTTKE